MKRKSRLIRTLPLTILLAISCAAIASAQWSAAQKEVWSVVEKSQEAWAAGDLEGVYESVHPDFSWWVYGTHVPGDFDAAMAYDKQNIAAEEVVAWDAEPLEILVYDTFAVVHFYSRSMNKNTASGEVSFQETRGTEVFKKEDGRWLTVANHWGNVNALE